MMSVWLHMGKVKVITCSKSIISIELELGIADVVIGEGIAV